MSQPFPHQPASAGAMVLAMGSSGFAREEEQILFPLAALGDLTTYPNNVIMGVQPGKLGLYATVLPESNLVVILRPITRSEYGTFQVQAIGYQMIEQRMLAAAIVLPIVTAADVAGFSDEIVTFLEQQVNAISGFSVFNELNGSSSP